MNQNQNQNNNNQVDDNNGQLNENDCDVVVVVNNLRNNSRPRTVRNKSTNDNLRDIGTWSNEQAVRPGRGGARGVRQNHDDWDNQEEEWQGDLSKTQIFTSSKQQQQQQQQQQPVVVEAEHQTK